MFLDVHLMIDKPERYIEAFAAAGADLITFHVEATPHGHRVLQSIHAQGLKAGIVLNPGTSLETIDAWARSHPQTLFIVDEAYLAFAATACSSLTIGMNNILVLRSMTKDYALAGLRLGYAVSHEDVIDALERVRPPWSVNSMAQAAGVAVLADEEHLQSSLDRLARANEALVTGLRKLGLTPFPSAVHFFLVPVEDGAAFRRQLLRQKIMVRDCASFGLPAYVRIATRRPEENSRLLDAIQEMV
jgi:histidinol-phosphate/aromatic aminotransferase/cobyric acid decarboxylase-like protein